MRVCGEMNRHALAHWTAITALALAANACGRSHDVGPRPDGGLEPDGGGGICCPIASFTGCSPGADPLPGGGWSPSRAECDYTIAGWDGSPYERVVDDHGCPRLEEDPADCCGCPPPPDCARIGGPAECLATGGCVPVLDDACCPSCSAGGFCADCVDYEFVECRPREEACPMPSCGLLPSGACEGIEPDCGSARPVGLDACDIPGCVPSFPSSEGAPHLAEATCSPIRATSCRAFCLSLPPPCPEGTVAEEDGSCHTGRCIPRWVCTT